MESWKRCMPIDHENIGRDTSRPAVLTVRRTVETVSELGSKAVMSRSDLKFKESDVRRAIKSVRKAGERVARVEIDPSGKIVVIVGPEAAPPTVDPELEIWLADEN
jgi:predicted metal-dependent TIM-barrel fold hydrolase